MDRAGRGGGAVTVPREVVADAPGRVNLLGEHTDYNDGFVLPMAIPQRTRVTLVLRDDRWVSVHSAQMNDEERSYQLGGERRQGAFVDYVQGVTAMFAEDGHALAGFDLSITSEVPIGGGLSSSAALMVAVARAIRAAFEIDLDDLAIAKLAHRAETGFVGAPVGLLDPIACSLADERHALFVDTRSLALEKVALPESVELVIVDSGIAHDHATGDYRVRRAECTRAAELLSVRALRDVADPAALDALPDPLRARARHVLSENARVHEGVAAMRRGDVARLGQLFLASHASMRDDFAVSTPDVDALVELAAADPAILGARLTGGGFGGAIVALARVGEARAAGERVVEQYRRKTGRPGRLLVPSE
ncbi:MAG: galactokinase [Deltaproteobacteria bacterium]|nr:galactokinase [Deltaproteobacteria bacterium]